MPNSKSQSISNSPKISSNTLKTIKKIQSNFRNRQKKTQTVKTIQRQFRKFLTYPICAICQQPISNPNKLNFYCSQSDQHQFHDQCIFDLLDRLSEPYPTNISCPLCRVGNMKIMFNKKSDENPNNTYRDDIKARLKNLKKNISNTSRILKDFDKLNVNKSKVNEINNMKKKLQTIFDNLDSLHNLEKDESSLIEKLKQKNYQEELIEIQKNLDYIERHRQKIERYLNEITDLHKSLINDAPKTRSKTRNASGKRQTKSKKHRKQRKSKK